MKKLMRTFALMAVAALGLSACTGEKLVPDTGNADGKFVTVHFGAEAAIEGATKATLTTEDELTFKSAWENGDALSVEYSNDNGAAGATGIVPATWTTDHFEATLPEHTGMWSYNVVYPAPAAEGVVDFGSARTQKGNAYNSKYDLMKGGAIAERAAAGKTAEGGNIVFEMTRQTAIAYFHFTSTLNEEVVSAKLSVEGGNIASSLVMVSEKEYSKGFDLSVEDLAEITITYEDGTAPKASDFKLWFNVLPTTYTKMTLTVETVGHTLTISRAAEGMYLDGKLYKVVKTIPADKWVEKGGETPSTKDFTLVTGALSDWTGSYLLVGKYTETTPKSSYYAFDESVYVDSSWGKCTEVVVDNNAIASAYGTMALEIVPGTTANTYSILTPSGKYFSASAKGAFNLLETYSADNCDFTIVLGENNAIVIKQASSTKERQIQYNHNDGKGGLRWYDKGTTVLPVYLYKGPSVAKYVISFATVEGGSFSASPSRAEAGAEITLTATPAEGYAFNNDWSVKGADESVIEVVDGKFIMPAQNVTVSGTFKKVVYTITKAAAENGSFTVKNGTKEVTTAFKGDKLTLEATPAEGFIFGKWTVTYLDGETEKSFNPSANTFNMPAANVTVSATFVEAAAVPVYASVAELIAAGKPTEAGTKVTVTLTDEEITKFYKYGKYTNGVYFMVGTQEVQIYCKNTPSDWKVGGTISGTLTNCDWMLYDGSTWELRPANYSELTYKAPIPTCTTPVITIAEGGVVSITCETAGATIHYTAGDAPADPTETDAVFSAVTLTDGQTIKAIAVAEGFKQSAVASKKYVVGGSTTPVLLYTLTPVKGKNSSYTGNCDVTVAGITWNLTGNSQMTPWRLGGNNITKADRALYSKTAYPKALTSIKVTFGEAKNITVNSCKLVYSTNADFTNSKECNIAFKASSTVEVTENFPANAYYKLVLNVTNSTKSNKFVELSKIEFFGLDN